MHMSSVCMLLVYIGVVTCYTLLSFHSIADSNYATFSPYAATEGF